MSDSILDSIKKLLNLSSDYTAFDEDLIIQINTVFADLNQLGVGPSDGYEISDKTDKWSDYITSPKLNSVRTLIQKRCQLAFDPPQNAFLVTSAEEICKRLEFRLMVAATEVQNES